MTEPAPTTQTPIYDQLVHEWADKSMDDARHRLGTDPVVADPLVADSVVNQE